MINVAIMGHGVVGSGVAEILINHPKRIADKVKDEVNPLADAPDMLYILYRYIIVFNDFNNEMMMVEIIANMLLLKLKKLSIVMI